MEIKDHCKKCVDYFGKPYQEVHEWLDGLASILISLGLPQSEIYKHRQFRHHVEGVKKINKEFGYVAKVVAEQHIRDDNEGKFPNEEDYDIPEYELSKEVLEGLRRKHPEDYRVYVEIHGLP